MSQSGSNRYRIDSVGLQRISLGLPLQMLGAGHGGVQLEIGISQTFQNAAGRLGDGPNTSSATSSHQYLGEVEVQKTVDGIEIRKVYVTNIASYITHTDVCIIFSQFGIVAHVYLSITRGNPSKQFAFVTFRDPKDAAKALKRGRLNDYRGRNMYISAADSWHQPQAGPNGEIFMPPRMPLKKTTEESVNEEEDSETVESPLKTVLQVEESGLNALNDDCLLHIFSFLSLKEITGVERVCKRWQALSYQMWKCLHELNLSNSDFKVTTHILEQHLKRCGESLSHLELMGKTNYFNKATVATIAKYCSNIEVLRIANINLGNRSLAHLGRCCPNLKHLTIDHCSKFTDFDLLSFLPKCQQLSELNLFNSHDITGKFLANIESPMKLNVLKLRKCPQIKTSSLVVGLKKMSETLYDLSLVSCGLEEVNRMLPVVPNLTSLSLCNSISHFGVESPTNIGHLKKLTCLDLTQNNAITDKVIGAIVDGCEELTRLILCGSDGTCVGSLTERGLSLLGRLHKLRHLDISYVEEATDLALTNITTRNSRLTELVCRGCQELTDNGVSQVISTSNDLELFDLSACSIGEPTVTAALTSVKMRTNNVHLRLIVGGTNFKALPEGFEPSKLLTVDMRNYSDEQFRPDHMGLFYPPNLDSEDEDLDNLCCDCVFSDLYDPTLFPDDIEDEGPLFRGYEDNYSDDCNSWVEDDDDYDDSDIYVHQAGQD